MDRSLLGPRDPLWYKDAIVYQMHVRSFFDSDGDGIGDFRGAAEKLDYIQDLGVNAVWLMPFYPSPLRDDGYDISDFTAVHPSYGTMRDFTAFLREARERSIDVITELVINHTSDQHPWFKRARAAPPGSRLRDFYVWSDSPEKYREARVIFQDFEGSNWTFDPVAKAYYWHRFYSHQPDLNYDNPRVLRAVLQVLDFWMGLGVSGMRLDAIPYLFEREGTSCENLPETHQVLKEVRRHLDQRFPNRMLLAEANQWSEDAVAYFGRGDECHMSFHFPVMPRMFMALRMEDRFPLVDIFSQTPAIPESAQWAIFLRNHDELTLEMVTDEERDYMYRLYAQDPRARINLGIRRRLAPLLSNDRKKIELMKGLLFSLPGTPVMYYGDEIGMGDNYYLGDRNAVRTPMQWSGDRNAGFSRANPQRLFLPVIIDPEYHYEAVNVEAQQANPDSLLWWTKRLIALRKRHKAFGRGTLEFLAPDNRKVLAFLRRYEDQTVLVVANLSRLAQHTQVALPGFEGRVPLELSGRTEFPPVGSSPYFLTLGPYGFYWFSLEQQRASVHLSPQEWREAPVLATRGDEWMSLFSRSARPQVADVLMEYIRARRWYGGKSREVQSYRIPEVVPLADDDVAGLLVQLEVEYVQGEPESYLIPVACAFGDEMVKTTEESPATVIGRVSVRGERGVLYDAMSNPRFCTGLLEAINRHRVFHGERGEVTASRYAGFRSAFETLDPKAAPVLLKLEQSNSSVVFGDRLILKLYRRPGRGTNPELEMGRALREKGGFTQVPPVLGALEYRWSRVDPPMTVAVLQGYVPNLGDGWSYTVDFLFRSFDRVLAQSEGERPPMPDRPLLDLLGIEPPGGVMGVFGEYLEAARLLGRCTAEMHSALAQVTDNAAFAPEPFSMLYQRSRQQAMRAEAVQVLQLLRRRQPDLPEDTARLAERILAQEEQVLSAFAAVSRRRINAKRLRVHGDYHLGQVLRTERDFVIIDFEGEPARPVSERRLKRTAMVDVAGMLRSFHYASETALLDHIRQEDIPRLRPWCELWLSWVSAAYLDAYLRGIGAAEIVPKDREELALLLNAHLLNRALYEVQYDLNNRPAWVRVPLEGILQVLGTRVLVT